MYEPSRWDGFFFSRRIYINQRGGIMTKKEIKMNDTWVNDDAKVSLMKECLLLINRPDQVENLDRVRAQRRKIISQKEPTN